VFYWRVVAEWYKQHNPERYYELTSAGDISRWHSNLQGWSLNALWKDYVKSVRLGEYDVKRTENVDGMLWNRTYFHGGVDMSEVVMTVLSTTE